jgi:hypothetical protein
VDVSVPRIRIVGPVTVSANLATATMHTIETWLVRAEASASGTPGPVLFAETNVHHTIMLDRTPTMLCLDRHCLHKWVVIRIRLRRISRTVAVEQEELTRRGGHIGYGLASRHALTCREQ